MSGTPSLVELTDVAFAPRGPVQRVLGQHRPIQTKIAHDFAVFITEHREDPHTSVALSEQRGGLGKTAAYSIVLLLHIALTDERAAYATFTRALRGSIRDASQLYTRIVRDTLLAQGLRYTPVQVVEYHSPTAFVSPTKIAAIRSRLQQGRIPSDDAAEVREFLAIYDESERPCEFADLYAVLDGLPCGWTELSLALSHQDRATEDWGEITRWREQAQQPRTLLLLTHALTIRNNLRGGTLFNDDEPALQVRTLVVDEADKLPSVATSALRITVSRNEISAVMEEARGVLSAAERSRGERILVQGLDQLGDALAQVNISYNRDDAAAQRIAQAMMQVAEGLSDLILPASRSTDILLVERLRLCRDNARALSRFGDFEHPIMRVQMVRDSDGKSDIALTLEMGGGRRLISRIWRSNQFETITMVSALMTNMPPYANRYDRFRRDIDLDRSKGDRVIEREPLQPSYGGIRKVIVADRVASLLPTDAEEPDLLRRSSLDGLAKQIMAATAPRRRTQRTTVVLFQSYNAMLGVFDRLPEPVQDRVVMRHGRHLTEALNDLVDTPNAIWFGVEWEGINFVHPRTRRTLVDTLIITRLPLAPRDEIRVMRIGNAIGSDSRAQSVALFEGVHAAYRKLYHGLLMGIRAQQDVIDELWILDPRWPLPPSVYLRQPPQIIRSLNGNLFSHFDRVLDPYTIRHWSKVDAEGVVTQLVGMEAAA